MRTSRSVWFGLFVRGTTCRTLLEKQGQTHVTFSYGLQHIDTPVYVTNSTRHTIQQCWKCPHIIPGTLNKQQGTQILSGTTSSFDFYMYVSIPKKLSTMTSRSLLLYLFLLLSLHFKLKLIHAIVLNFFLFERNNKWLSS